MEHLVILILNIELDLKFIQMKRITFTLFAIFMVFLLSNFTLTNNIISFSSDENSEYNIPIEISGIIQNSCYGCHHTDSENEKGKKKLDFDKIGGEYNAIKSAGKLRDISKVLVEKEMPPEKFLTHYPEKALSDSDYKKLSDWAKEMSGNLLGK